MFEWAQQNSSAVQAIASVASLLVTIVLACLTARYVRLTKRLADSAVAQLELAEALEAARHTRTIDALVNLSRRVRVALGSLEPNTPRHGDLIKFTAVAAPDLNDLEALARQVGVPHLAAPAVAALRHFLGLRDRVAAINELRGWAPTAAEVTDHATSITSAIAALQSLEQALSAGTHAA